jgi:hypothetical protein
MDEVPQVEPEEEWWSEVHASVWIETRDADTADRYAGLTREAMLEPWSPGRAGHRFLKAAIRAGDVKQNADGLVSSLDCWSLWPSPAYLSAGHPSSLADALWEVRREESDCPRFFLMHPSVCVEGLNFVNGKYEQIPPAVFEAAFEVDRTASTITVGSIIWGGVTVRVGVVNHEGRGGGGDLPSDGLATVRAVVAAIIEDRRRLGRKQFLDMARKLIEPRPKGAALAALWRRETPARWQATGQGSPAEGIMVEDWKSYLPKK